MKQAGLLVISLLLFSGVAGAGSSSDTTVTLKEYIESRIDEQDRRVQQQQSASGIAIEKALLSELRVQAAMQEDRYALKVEVTRLTDRVATLESTKINTYVGLIIVGVLGIANLLQVIWGKVNRSN